MAPTPMILSENEGHFAVKTFLLSGSLISGNIARIRSNNVVFTLHMNRKAHVACNLNCPIETEELLNVTGSHMRSDVKCGNILETAKTQTSLLQNINTSTHQEMR